MTEPGTRPLAAGEPTPTPITISTWFVNRLLAYSIPGLWVVLGVRGYLSTFDLKALLVVLLFAALFVVPSEIWLFGFRVRLSGDELSYRKRGLALSSEITLDRRAIRSVRHCYFSRGGGMKAARLLIFMGNRDEPIDLVMASFSPKDIRFLTQWLPEASRSTR